MGCRQTGGGFLSGVVGFGCVVAWRYVQLRQHRLRHEKYLTAVVKQKAVKIKSCKGEDGGGGYRGVVMGRPCSSRNATFELGTSDSRVRGAEMPSSMLAYELLVLPDRVRFFFDELLFDEYCESKGIENWSVR